MSQFQHPIYSVPSSPCAFPTQGQSAQSSLLTLSTRQSEALQKWKSSVFIKLKANFLTIKKKTSTLAMLEEHYRVGTFPPDFGKACHSLERFPGTFSSEDYSRFRSKEEQLFRAYQKDLLSNRIAAFKCLLDSLNKQSLDLRNKQLLILDLLSKLPFASSKADEIVTSLLSDFDLFHLQWTEANNKRTLDSRRVWNDMAVDDTQSEPTNTQILKTLGVMQTKIMALESSIQGMNNRASKETVKAKRRHNFDDSNSKNESGRGRERTNQSLGRHVGRSQSRSNRLQSPYSSRKTTRRQRSHSSTRSISRSSGSL
jgi:hypothetical protein